jgi:phenylpyruvate tautomerase PptA (4-oxalocrotonate tautomerase family)
MPLIQVKLAQNTYTPEQRKQMITRLTDAMAGIIGEILDPITCIVVEEPRSSPRDFEVPMNNFQVLASRVNCPDPSFEELLQYI